MENSNSKVFTFGKLVGFFAASLIPATMLFFIMVLRHKILFNFYNYQFFAAAALLATIIYSAYTLLKVRK